MLCMMDILLLDSPILFLHEGAEQLLRVTVSFGIDSMYTQPYKSNADSTPTKALTKANEYPQNK